PGEQREIHPVPTRALPIFNAEEGGADRIEVCENLSEGGTTPSYGLLLKTRHQVSIPVHVLIRPRAGDFLYSDLEFEVMKEDIKLDRKSTRLNSSHVKISYA